MEALSRKPVWILDLAMPRDVEADCGTVEGVTLWNLDDLHSSTAPDKRRWRLCGKSQNVCGHFRCGAITGILSRICSS
ncbi:MAG: hypothetical protein ACLR5S_11425 [Ruminococcus sp.]